MCKVSKLESCHIVFCMIGESNRINVPCCLELNVTRPYNLSEMQVFYRAIFQELGMSPAKYQKDISTFCAA